MLKQFKVIDFLKDERTQCHSILLRLKVEDYLDAIKDAYQEHGGVEGQRPILTTKTAKQIRARMVDDLGKGALLPAIVVGILIPVDMPQLTTEDDFNTLLRTTKQLSIIDGMQRTTALEEARTAHPEINKADIRVECWMAKSIDSLIYRMLVLNTGQIPWGLKRQLEVVFRREIEDLQRKVPGLSLYTESDGARRKAPGQYQANNFLELFMAFGLRHENVSVQEQLIDEFAKLDFIQASSTNNFTDDFVATTKLLVQFDEAFSKYRPTPPVTERFVEGLDVFSAHPARIGFVVAIAQHIMGKLGNDIPAEQQPARLKETQENAASLLRKINSNGFNISEFLSLDTLEAALPKKVSRVGEHDRKFFKAAFDDLVKSKFNVESMGQCWKAGQYA